MKYGTEVNKNRNLCNLNKSDKEKRHKNKKNTVKNSNL